MLKIFAKKGTNEKALVPVPNDKVRDAMVILNEQLGGDWVYVDKLQPGEFLLFKDETIYRGFDGKSERYSDAIKKLP